MAYDRLINFKNSPSKKDLQFIIEDYFGAAATKVYWNKDRFFIDLAGNFSFPFYRIKSLSDSIKARMALDHQIKPRWIEVWKNKKSVDVITRQADEFTNVAADGLASMICRFFDGKLEESGY